MKRKIIRIDEERCTGCGLCIPNCPEGALRVIDGKARIVGELLCDGLGACIGHCPEGAITIEMREAEPYDERKVIAGMARQGQGVVEAHLAHLRSHGEWEHLAEAAAYLAKAGIDVPAEYRDHAGSARRPHGDARLEEAIHSIAEASDDSDADGGAPTNDRSSRLHNWPVQISLVPPMAPFLDGADLLIAADCVPFAFAGFHEDLLEGRACVVGCPKLDDAEKYLERLEAVFAQNDVRSVLIAYMEVPCCHGMVRLVESAIQRCGKQIPLETRMFSVKGAPMRRA